VDFGTADFICPDTKTFSCAGTYYFMAPEVISLSKGQSYDPISADIWSLGVTMFSMAFLEVPFQGKTLQELVRSIQESRIRFGKGQSDGFRKLIEAVLKKEPKDRFTLKQIMEDKWIN